MQSTSLMMFASTTSARPVSLKPSSSPAWWKTADSSAKPLSTRLAMLTRTDSGSRSKPATRPQPSWAAESARMPEPQPASVIDTVAAGCVARKSIIRMAHRRVVGWSPVPKARPASNQITAASAGTAYCPRIQAGTQCSRPWSQGLRCSLYASFQSLSARVVDSYVSGSFLKAFRRSAQASSASALVSK